MKTNSHIKRPNSHLGLMDYFMLTATAFAMWTIHVELSWPKAQQRKINVIIN